MSARQRVARARNAALAFPVHRPWLTLALIVALTLLALAGASRLRPDTSLQALFTKDDPAAEAMVRVLDGYGAVEELLVLVTVPGDETDPQPARLLDFARRFEGALRSAPDGAALVADVSYRPDPDIRRFVEEVMFPAGIDYLSDAEFAAARDRLTPEGMRVQLARNEALLAQPGPAAAAAARALLRDPLRLYEFLKPKLARASGGSFATFEGEDALLAPDGRALLIRVAGTRSPSDLTFCKSLVVAATRAAESANTDSQKLDVSFGGAYAIATASEQALRRDSTESVTGAFAGLIVLFALVYRRPVRLLLLAMGPLALGTVLGFGAYATFAHTTTILSAAVGAMMVGMGIDYSVHYLTHYEKRRTAGDAPAEAAAATSRGMFAALFAGWITSVMGFAVLGTSRVPALGTFALLGSLGLAGVFVTSLTVIPALLVLTDRERANGGARAGVNRARLRFSVEPLLGWIARNARLCVATSLAVFVAALAIAFLLPGPILALESDLTVMHPSPNPALRTQDEIARRFGSVPGSMLVLLRAQTPEQLVGLAHEVDRRLAATELRNAGVSGTVGLATFLPDPRAAEHRRAEVTSAEADRVVADFRAAVADSAFESARFDAYARALPSILRPPATPTVSDLLRYPRLARSFFPSGTTTAPTEAITLVSLSGTLDRREERAAAVSATRAALHDLPGATLTGLPVLGHDAEATVARAVPPLFGISLALVLVYVIVHFRSLRDALLSLTTAAFGMVVLLAVMRLAGVRVNMINLIGLPLLIGMTVDYGIFLVSLARLGRQHGGTPGAVREHVASSAQAVIVCAGATLLGFGSLMFTSVPAVRSLGLVVAVGMASALVGALFLLAPILLTQRPARG